MPNLFGQNISYEKLPQTNDYGSLGAQVLTHDNYIFARCNSCYFNLRDAIYIFEDTGSGWEHTETLISEYLTLGTELVYRDGRLYAGTFDDFNQGKILVFQKGEDSWDLVEEIQPPYDDRPSDHFGTRIAMNDSLLVTRSLYYEDQKYGGRLFVYHKTADSFEHIQTIYPIDSTVSNFFAGNIAFVEDMLIATDDSDRTATSGIGTASVYSFQNGQFERVQKISGTGLDQFDNFGSSLSVSNDWMVIGCAEADDDDGAIFIYRFDGTTWGFQQKIEFGANNTSDYFGLNVLLHNDLMFVYSTWDASISRYTGSVDMLLLENGVWSYERTLRVDSLVDQAGFGSSMSYKEPNLTISAPSQGTGFFSPKGALYNFDMQEYSSVKTIRKPIEISLFPNPSNGVIQFTEEDKERYDYVQVVDITGRVVLDSKDFQNSVLDLRFLDTGLYNLLLWNENELARSSVLIQR